MATDKLINSTQGDSMITALGNIATNINTITYGPQTSADKVVSMSGYQEPGATSAISQGDTLNQAIGKLEKKADTNAADIVNINSTIGDIHTIILGVL